MQQTFEDAIQRLEKIVVNLENGDVPLDESLKLFEEGTNLAKFCMNKLNQAEKKLQRLNKKENGSFQLELIP